jgi:hypothetical protein
MVSRFGNLGILVIAPACAFLASCGAPGLPAKATVTLIDRKCDIIETIEREVDDPRGSGATLKAHEMNSKTGECKSVDEWDEVREKRSKAVKGTAAVHVEYQAPQDGSYRQATLNFTGRDDEFYELNAGDSVDIIVAADDPGKIRKA